MKRDVYPTGSTTKKWVKLDIWKGRKICENGWMERERKVGISKKCESSLEGREETDVGAKKKEFSFFFFFLSLLILFSPPTKSYPRRIGQKAAATRTKLTFTGRILLNRKREEEGGDGHMASSSSCQRWLLFQLLLYATLCFRER